MGAHGIEILANAHIANYPYPTEEWINNWWALCRKYDIEPVEYGHWLDCRLYQDRLLNVDEAVEFLSRDLHLAHRLGFKFLRTKMTVKDGDLAPIDNWQDIIIKALPLAERLGLVMLPEIHTPSSLTEGFINDYVDFIKKTGTKNFGLNIDWKQFSANALFNFKKGGKLFSVTEYSAAHAGTAARTEERSSYSFNGTTVDAQKFWTNSPAEEFMYDASFLKLGEASIGYNISRKCLDRFAGGFIRTARFSVYGSNLVYLISHTPGTTPDGSSTDTSIFASAFDMCPYPTTRNFGASITIGF